MKTSLEALERARAQFMSELLATPGQGGEAMGKVSRFNQAMKFLLEPFDVPAADYPRYLASYSPKPVPVDPWKTFARQTAGAGGGGGGSCGCGRRD